MAFLFGYLSIYTRLDVVCFLWLVYRCCLPRTNINSCSSPVGSAGLVRKDISKVSVVIAIGSIIQYFITSLPMRLYHWCGWTNSLTESGDQTLDLQIVPLLCHCCFFFRLLI